MASLKIVVVGDSGVGKTTFVNRVADARSEARFWSTRATIGAEFIVRKTLTVDGPVSVTLWDTAGQERFRALSKTYFRGSDGFVFVYDATQRDSYFHLFGYWLSAIREVCDTEDAPVLLLANKTDLPGREVSATAAAQLCVQRGWYYAEVCAERPGSDAAQAIDWFAAQLVAARPRKERLAPLLPLQAPPPSSQSGSCAC